MAQTECVAWEKELDVTNGLSEDSMGRSPLFIYCSGDRSSCIAIATSVVGVASTDMAAESSAQDDQLLPPRSVVQGFTVR
jgi:hypothetical protein